MYSSGDCQSQRLLNLDLGDLGRVCRHICRPPRLALGPKLDGRARRGERGRGWRCGPKLNRSVRLGERASLGRNPWRAAAPPHPTLGEIVQIDRRRYLAEGKDGAGCRSDDSVGRQLEAEGEVGALSGVARRRLTSIHSSRWYRHVLLSATWNLAGHLAHRTAGSCTPATRHLANNVSSAVA